MAGETVVGVLRADLSLDTAEFQAGAQRAKKTLGGLKNDFDAVSDATRKSGGFGAGFSDFVSKNDWKIKQFSMQMSQMSQSIAATGQVVRSVTMQLPDMAAMLGGKFFLPAMIISSVAAMAAPMIASFFETKDAAKESEKGVNALSAALQKYSEASKIAHADTADLTNEYGRFADQARQNAKTAQLRAMGKIKDLFSPGSDGDITAEFEKQFAAITEYNERLHQLEGLQHKDPVGTAKNAGSLTALISQDAEQAAKNLGLTVDQLKAVGQALAGIRAADDSDIVAMGAAAQRFKDVIDSAVPPGTPMNPALEQMYKALEQLISTAQTADAKLSATFDNMAIVAGQTADAFSTGAAKAREMGNTGLSGELQKLSTNMRSVVDQYNSGIISGEQMREKLAAITADAGSANGALSALDGATFGNVLAGLEALRKKAAEVAAAAAAAANAANVRTTINNQTSRGFSPGSVSFGNPFSGTTVSRNDPLGDGGVAPIESAGARAQTWVATQMRSTQLSKEQLTLETEIASVKREAAAAGQQITEEQARQIAQSRLQQQTGFKDAGGGGGGRGGSSTDKYTQTITRLKDQIAAARLEMTQGALAAQIYNQQIAAGVAPASAAGQQIATLATQLDALQQKQQLVEGIKGAFGQFFTSILTGSASAKEALGQLFASIAQALAQAAINKLFSTLFAGTVFAFANGTGPGGVPGFANGTLKIPGYANGTSAANRLAMVGERGPELVSIAQGSRVYSKSETQRMLSQGGGRGGQLGISLADGLKAEWIGEAANNSVSITQNAFKQYDKSFNARSAKYKNDPRSRG
ncbi:hypothetical protein [Rhodobacter capsulatus]|uniref:hypothetical protein n=1 Tax=Rhodobacter capsulatus TaxID=1061 RepID=UPI0040270025